MVQLKKVFTVLALLIGGLVLEAQAQSQSACNMQCDAPHYCITNREVDCGDIDITVKVQCPSGFDTTLTKSIPPTSCGGPPTQRCVPFPSCDCEITEAYIYGDDLDIGRDNCVQCGGTGFKFNIYVTQKEGICIDYGGTSCGSITCP